MKQIVTIFALFLVMMNLSCQQQNRRTENPLLEKWETPYGVPPFDEIELSHYKPAFETAMAAHVAEIEAIMEESIIKYGDFGQLVLDGQRASAMNYT